MKKEVHIIYHPSYELDYPTAGCECPPRVTSIMNTLSKKYPVFEPETCSEDDILLCHTKRLLESEKNSDHRRHEIACLAAGGAILAAEKATEGILPFAVIRPPGHHASNDSNWGFCFYNNIAISLRVLQRDGLIRTGAILDIDLHFGDGSDNIFIDDDSINVLNIQSGYSEEFIKETKDGLNSLPNVDILAVSAGFDQYIKDWGANLSTEDYYKVGEIAGRYAKNNCESRIYAILEGGYYIEDLGKNTLSLIQGMQVGLQ